jgi:hypothetical protein
MPGASGAALALAEGLAFAEAPGATAPVDTADGAAGVPSDFPESQAAEAASIVTTRAP